MDIRGVVPLDEASLLAAAMKTTGLSDFGTDEWREPFQVWLRSLEEDAALNLTGRLRTRSEILQLLEARLQVEDTYQRHPEIEQEEIRQPIFIVGQGRSGTSFLCNVLAANPDNGALMQWEAMFPRGRHVCWRDLGAHGCAHCASRPSNQLCWTGTANAPESVSSDDYRQPALQRVAAPRARASAILYLATHEANVASSDTRGRADESGFHRRTEVARERTAARARGALRRKERA